LQGHILFSPLKARKQLIMKKIFLLFFTTVLAINISNAQTAWITYRIDSKLSVKLPAQPKTIDANSIMTVGKDSLTCIVTKVDFLATVQMDAGALAPLMPTQEFANELRTGLLSQIPGFTLGDIKIGKWNGYYSYSVEGGNISKKSKLYTFMVIIGSEMYSLSAMIPDSKSAKGKDDFFASLSMN
jgi:hypothetical protein